MMKRLYVVCEGHTESSFVQAVLAPALVPVVVYGLPPRKPHGGGPKHYGGVRWQVLRRMVIHTLRMGSDVYCTTMIDYYRLANDFPKPRGHCPLDPADKAAALHAEMIVDIRKELHDPRDGERFIPFVVMHEFEGMLFSKPAILASVMSTPTLAPQLQEIRDLHPTPEHIDDGIQTAPSVRLLGLNPKYDKKRDGVNAASEIGLPAMEAQCPNFARWLAALRLLQSPEAP